MMGAVGRDRVVVRAAMGFGLAGVREENLDALNEDDRDIELGRRGLLLRL